MNYGFTIIRAPRGHAQTSQRAAEFILKNLWDNGFQAHDIPDAIARGWLTDLEWCEALNRERELAEPPAVSPRPGLKDRQIVGGHSLTPTEAEVYALICQHPGIALPRLNALRGVGGSHGLVLRLQALALIRTRFEQTGQSRHTRCCWPVQAAV